jgi:hypothetical protein
VIHLARCPLIEVPSAVWELTEMADLYKKGLPPVAGGVLDQAAAFVSGCRCYWNECERIKAERKESGQ